MGRVAPFSVTVSRPIQPASVSAMRRAVTFTGAFSGTASNGAVQSSSSMVSAGAITSHRSTAPGSSAAVGGMDDGVAVGESPRMVGDLENPVDGRKHIAGGAEGEQQPDRPEESNT